MSPSVSYMFAFPSYRQAESKDCGPTCLRIIAKHYGRSIDTHQLRELGETTREGTSLLGLAEAAEHIGFRTLGIQLDFEKLREVPLPCIIHWNSNHYVVLYKITQDKLYISDPERGRTVYSKKEFLKHWIGEKATENSREGIALVLEPTPTFFETDLKPASGSFGFGFILKYVLRYKSLLIQLVLGLLAGSLLQLVLPFLTQSIVDVGIRNQDINFVYLILAAQLFLFLGKASLEVIRSWILLHLSTRINISLISDFFVKLMNLPIAFFDARMTGDILQRINDHKRIEQILTTSSLSMLFTVFNLVIFSVVLGYYNLQILLVFLAGSAGYLGWVLFFFKKRKQLDYQRFAQISEEQTKVIELITGMQEIKLHNAERQMRWSWEDVQARLFRISIKNLALEQTQSVGSNFINELTNILITVLAAKLVIDGNITLGMMLAISYIVGQLNGPIAQLIDFMRDLQDARISLDRLGEIHQMENEEESVQGEMRTIPNQASITLRGVTFRYPGGLYPVLENLDLHIPENKVTAIVGSSGSGKTTLMKLLLRFYHPETGEILLNDSKLSAVSPQQWRERCGVVMQEGFLFNASIAKNIAIGKEHIDTERMRHAMKVANITTMVERLPSGLETIIGAEGTGLSTGQKQRILIARAVYKDPEYLFFDEATSALDAKNEKEIMEHLDTFFKDRTAIVIAHRLSTVKNAHQIVVLDEGRIVEKGDHVTLIKQKGTYYRLVKNQLELGS